MSNNPRATIRAATFGSSETQFKAADMKVHGPLRRLVAEKPKLFAFDDDTGVYTLREEPDIKFLGKFDEGTKCAVKSVVQSMERAGVAKQTDEDDDWIPLKKLTASWLKPDLVVTIKAKEGAKAGKAAIVFRGEAAKYLDGMHSIDVDVGGSDLNKLRIRAYKGAAGGQFPLSRTGRGGTSPLRAQFAVELWPNEDREHEASFAIKPAEGHTTYLVATLPKDWAKPIGEIKDAPKVNGAGLPRVDPGKAGAAARAVAGLPPQPAPARSASSIPMGGPPPGRSALDQRRAGK